MSKVTHTPTPWRKSNITSDAIVSDATDGISQVEIDGYGGKFICESMRGCDQDFTLIAVNHHQELVTRLYNLVNAETLEEIAFRKAEALETLKKVIQ